MDSFNSIGERFWTWLQTQGVCLSPKIALHDYRSRNQGRGLIAKEDILKDEVLFTIPENAVLSAKTSSLKTRLPEVENVDEWMSLILVMIFENQQADSRWKEYFDILPEGFDTPMFWTNEELQELKGTEVIARIGKEKSEEQYNTVLFPIIKANPGLFDLEKCGLQAFHRMGSLILAYSFGLSDSANETDDEDEEQKENLAMVPLADMLNADPQLNNARIFHAENGWEMRSTQKIPQNEQIWNTYGNRPNSDLLRSYGYIIPGSKDDCVEIPADLIIKTISRLSENEVRQRIDILEEENWFEDAFEIPFSGKIPEEMYVFCLAITAEELSEGAIPQYRKTSELKSAVLEVLSKRMAEYSTSVEDDETLLQTELDIRKRMAIEVRLGEKRILKKAIDRVEAWDIERSAKRAKTS